MKISSQDLVKAAALCREAAEALKAEHSPEKLASELSQQMVSKGYIQREEKERYTQHLIQNPEKMASLKNTLETLPARVGAIGEVDNDKVASGGLDAFDEFSYS